MRISDLAKATNCDIETIRFYEKTGLLEPPPRAINGYRDYKPEHLERLQFIRHCRSLQIGLPDIRMLLDMKRDPLAGCDQVDALLEHQIRRVQAQMETLQMLQQELISLRRQCPVPRSIEKCGILQDLNAASSND